MIYMEKIIEDDALKIIEQLKKRDLKSLNRVTFISQTSFFIGRLFPILILQLL
jgi:hypothetical protein